MPGVRLFTGLQDAAFYRDFHAAAAGLMGPGRGRSWLDAGTGPGLLTRLAAANGYRAAGFDRDPQMIEAARRLGPSFHRAIVCGRSYWAVRELGNSRVPNLSPGLALRGQTTPGFHL